MIFTVNGQARRCYCCWCSYAADILHHNPYCCTHARMNAHRHRGPRNWWDLRCAALSTEITLLPTNPSLKTIHLHSRQCSMCCAWIPDGLFDVFLQRFTLFLSRHNQRIFWPWSSRSDQHIKSLGLPYLSRAEAENIFRIGRRRWGWTIDCNSEGSFASTNRPCKPLAFEWSFQWR
jgi:hypothetical protein